LLAWLKHERCILPVLIFGGLCLRVWGIRQDLPYCYYGDESYLIYHSLKFGTGDLNPHWFTWPTLFQYCLFFLFGVFYLLGIIFGWFKDKIDFLYLYLKDPTIFFLIGRLTAASLGTASIYLIYLIASKSYNKNTGLICSAIFAFLPLAVEYSHYAVVDTPLVFMILLSLFFILNIFLRGGVKNYLLSGFFTGLAIGTKYPAVFLILPLLLSHLLVTDKKGFFRIIFSPRLILCLTLVLAGFFMACPYAFLDFPKFFSDARGQILAAKVGWFGWENANPYFYHLTQNLKNGMSLPLLVFSMFGLLYAAIKRKKADLVLLSFPIAYFFSIGLDKNIYPRFMLPVLPFLALFSGRLLSDIQNWLKGRKGEFVFSGLFILILITPVYTSITIDLNLSLPNTMTLSKEWVEKNIPAGSKILMNEGGPPLVQSPDIIRFELEEKTEDRLPYAYHKKREVFYKIKEKVASEAKSYKLAYLNYPIGFLEGEQEYESLMKKTQEALNNYKNKYDFIVISEALTYKLTGYPKETIPKRYWKLRYFYEEILNNYNPVEVFYSKSNLSKGPVIRIYKLK
jgi:4-amino-4-deoxy-L-arabinose transferase-like glycosyltransferase